MSLPWVRLDTAFPRNHKVLVLLGMKEGHRSALVYLCGLSYCGEHGTDGFIPREALVFLHGRKADADRLVNVGLWHADGGGWLVNDWIEYQPSSEESEKRSTKARIAARARWDKKSIASKHCSEHSPEQCASAPNKQSTNGRTNGLTDVGG